MTWNAGLDLVEHRDGRADLTGRAIAALIAVMLHEGSLHRMQLFRRAQAFDRRDAGALLHNCERKTRIYSPPVDDHCARAALPLIAAFFGAGHLQILAQRIEQRGPDIELEVMHSAVDFKRHW